MASRRALEVVEAGLRDVMQSNEPFGGKVVVLGGDFRQVLPVVSRGSRAAQVEASIKRSTLWPLFRIFPLRANMRANQDNGDFAAWLLQLGEGLLPMTPLGEIEVPPQCIMGQSLIDDVFGERIALNDLDSLHHKVILCATNRSSLALNEEIIQKLPVQNKIYRSIDAANGDDAADFPMEFLFSLTPNGLPLPPHALHLKVGAIVMLLRNLDINRGLCNGARMVICRLHDHVLDCKLLGGEVEGKRVLIPRMRL